MPDRKNQNQEHPALKPNASLKTKPGSKFAFKNGASKLENNKENQVYSFAGENGRKKSVETEAENAAPKYEAKTGFKPEPNKAVLNSPSIFSASSARNSNDETEQEQKQKAKFLDKWFVRRGHALTYALLFAFTFVLYFRPYELIPGLQSFSSMALYFALTTLAVFLPSQLATEGSLTARPAEVNWILLLTLFGIVTIPIARDPVIAWEAFNDPFIKVVLMFIVMINVVRTEARLKGLIWLAMAVGVMLSFEVIKNYATGNLAVENYRAMAEIKGMFGNPNAQAMHFVSVTPIAIVLAFAARNFLSKLIYAALTILFIVGNMFTFSRGGFLGLIVAGLSLAWKIGRESRLQVMLISAVIGLIFIAVAPGNYGLRILSIFIPALDPVGSSVQRKDLLWTSIIVTLRNPWGIGMMNFPMANPHGLVSHNSYTQVSSEMGVLALGCYLMLFVAPFKRLLWIERELYENGQKGFIYYLAIGLQVSLVGYAVASFFDSAAYQWFLYYLVAYAVCLRRVYQISQESKVKGRESNNFLRLQTPDSRLQTSEC